MPVQTNLRPRTRAIVEVRCHRLTLLNLCDSCTLFDLPSYLFTLFLQRLVYFAPHTPDQWVTPSFPSSDMHISPTCTPLHCKPRSCGRGSRSL